MRGLGCEQGMSRSMARRMGSRGVQPFRLTGRRGVGALLCVAVAAGVLSIVAVAAREPSAAVVNQARVPSNSESRFFLGVSLFDALGLVPPKDADLDALGQWGISVLRVWAHWRDPIYDEHGALRPEGRTRLVQLVERLGGRGLILELVLLRPGQLPGEAFELFRSVDARIRAVRDITHTLQPYRNVIFDLYNEHDHPDGPISHRDARRLRDAVKAIDPDRLVTISSTEYHLLRSDGRLDDEHRANLREEVGTDQNSVGVDILAVHLPRTADWAEATARRVTTIRRALGDLGRRVPVHLSEERRAQEGEPLLAAAYLRAAEAAKKAGAVAWTFHTAAGYALDERPFLEALNSEERRALGQLRAAVMQP